MATSAAAGISRSMSIPGCSQVTHPEAINAHPAAAPASWPKLRALKDIQRPFNCCGTSQALARTWH